jgi:hypothetical protein
MRPTTACLVPWYQQAYARLTREFPSLLSVMSIGTPAPWLLDRLAQLGDRTTRYRWRLVPRRVAFGEVVAASVRNGTVRRYRNGVRGQRKFDRRSWCPRPGNEKGPGAGPGPFALSTDQRRRRLVLDRFVQASPPSEPSSTSAIRTVGAAPIGPIAVFGTWPAGVGVGFPASGGALTDTVTES